MLFPREKPPGFYTKLCLATLLWGGGAKDYQYSHYHIKAVLLSVPLNPHFPHLHECCLFHFYPPLPL